MPTFPRITHNPKVMGGKPCIRGLRVTVGAVVEMVAAGLTAEQVVEQLPYLEIEDVAEALRYAAWRLTESETSLVAA